MTMEPIAGHIGRQTLKTIDYIFNLFAFSYSLFKLILKRHKAGKMLVRRFTLEQIYFTGYQALYVIIPIALILGSTNIIIFSQASGKYDLGKIMVMLLVREIGPIVTALVVILRTATAVTIEIGYMKVLREIDAIEMAGLDPLRVICLPRLVGITVAIFCLIVVFELVSIIGGYMVVWFFTYIPMENLLRQIAKNITFTDIVVSMVKVFFFGITISITCMYHGFQTKIKVTEIPARTSKAAIECFFFCLIINVIISVVFYI